MDGADGRRRKGLERNSLPLLRDFKLGNTPVDRLITFSFRFKNLTGDGQTTGTQRLRSSFSGGDWKSRLAELPVTHVPVSGRGIIEQKRLNHANRKFDLKA